MARLEVVRGDITTFEADAIVNAANSALREGGGVCGAIFGAVKKVGGLKAHQQLTEACRNIGHCPTGDAAITLAKASSLNAHKSSILPPPLTKRMTST